MRKSMALLFTAFLIGAANAHGLQTNGFGLIMDVTGQPIIEKGEVLFDAEFGQEVAIGDRLKIEEQDQLVLVSYETCEEWTLSGPLRVSIENESQIRSESGMVSPSRHLPVCYKPELFAEADSDTLGGVLLRGAGSRSEEKSQAMDKLQQSADTGQASNSDLMSLIISSLKQGLRQQAIQYYEQLLNQNPGAIVPAPLAKHLDITN